jgi:hypothetical protein
MVFKLAQTWAKPVGSQQGFPTIGAGQQSLAQYQPPPTRVARTPVRPTKGFFSWLFPEGGGQQGMPGPLSPNQRRPAGTWGAGPPQYGLPIMVYTPYYDRGAAAYVPNYGKVMYNPIGAGVVAQYRPQASYGKAAQYANGALWWASQAIPTTVNLQGLTDPRTLAAMLGPIKIQGVVRTTG